jgi:filamentous hemagglutinin family protein
MISIVIVNYNQESYLRKAIASVLAQTKRDWELLIWDDGSTDNSVAIAREYEKQDSRIRVIIAQHQGVAKARRNAVAETTGDYIGWIDSDDWVADMALEETAKVLDSNPAIGMVYTDYYDVNSRGKVIGIGKRCNIPYSPQRLLVDFMTFHFRLLRREVYEQIGEINTDFKYVYDYDLCLRLSEITQVAKVPQPLYYYRHHCKSRSARYQKQRITWSEKAINQALQRRGLADNYSLQVEGDRFCLNLKKETKVSAPLAPQPWGEKAEKSPEVGGFRGRNFWKTAATLIATLPFTAAIATNPASAQQIVPNQDGTMTVITKDGNTFNIDGGTLSGDGKNLFHSFQEFGLDAGQIANFLSNPNIQNILGRINGGNPSLINGLIQVTGGNSNLFLMNPSGIIFGNNASLNVPGDFTATTATGIGFGDGWFNAVGTNDYLNLVGNPDSFNFANAESGVIINAGDLKVADGSNISLTGGTVINTGTIETEGGKITVAAIPGTNRVRISQEGQLLSIEVPIPQNAEGEALPIRVTDLPNLLKGLPVDIETGLEVAANYDVTVANSNTVLPKEAGTTIVSGTVDTSNTESGGIGGEVNILGDKVGLIGANVDASGDAGGGTVLVGGDYKGEGTVPNAEATLVDSNSTIKADALQSGDGGKVIVWADNTTQFNGNISARGGNASGDGGFVEVSGKNDLVFNGTVDTSAPNGNVGDLLLDPTNIEIVGSGYDTTNLNDVDQFSDPDLDTANNRTRILNTAINNATTNVTLQATNDILFNAPVNIATQRVGLTANANANNDGSGRVEINEPISTNGGNIEINGINVNVNQDIITNGGAIAINSGGTINSSTVELNSSFDEGSGGDINLTATENINLGGVDSSSFSESPEDKAGNVTVTSNNGAILAPPEASIPTLIANDKIIGIFANAEEGNGGAVTLSAAGDIQLLGIFSNSLKGNGGDISITSTNGGINATSSVPISEGSTETVPFGLLFSGTGGQNGGNITLQAAENITTGFIYSGSLGNGTGGTISLNSNNGNIDTSFGANLQPITVSGLIPENLTQEFKKLPSESFNNIFAGVSTFSLNNGGDINLTANNGNNIRVGSIVARGSTNNGGDIKVNVDNDNPGLFVAASTLKDVPVSIWTNSSNPEAITIKHGGNGEIPFEVGNPNLLEQDNPNGTVGAILAGNNEINNESFLFTEERGNIAIISVEPLSQEVLYQFDQIFDSQSPPPIESFQTATNNLPAKLTISSIPEARKILRQIAQQAAQKPALVYISFTSPEIKVGTNNPEEYFEKAESCLTAEYKQALELTNTQVEPTICLAAQPTDKLEILVVTPEGEPIYVPVDVTRAEVEEQAEKLYREVANKEDLWQEPAELLYEWLIGGIEEELKNKEIDNLLFVLPPKLRSLPLAALYDLNTEQFLVQKGYNIGLAPSINLMNTTYNKLIQNAEVLALGASNFETAQNQQPLNAVNVELPQIVNLRGGKPPILNEQFTLKNFQNSLNNNSFPIVHLSTHADFSTNSIDDIYIQLYDRRLTLNELRSLNLKAGSNDLELLVLSACRSAFGDTNAELGFAGLAIKLGVKTAIGSLWKVSDISTSGLMIEFYHQLKTSPIKAEALRLAQVAMIDGKLQIDLENRQMITSWGEVIELPENVVAELLDKKIAEIDLSHPHYWAPFTVIGSPW